MLLHQPVQNGHTGKMGPRTLKQDPKTPIWALGQNPGPSDGTSDPQKGFQYWTIG